MSTIIININDKAIEKVLINFIKKLGISYQKKNNERDETVIEADTSISPTLLFNSWTDENTEDTRNLRRESWRKDEF